MNFLFRCRNSCGMPAELGGAVVSAVLREAGGEVVFRFSSARVPGVKPVKVDRGYVFFRLLPEDSRALCGTYVVELKFRRDDLAMIGMTEKIRVHESAIGKDGEL